MAGPVLSETITAVNRPLGHFRGPVFGGISRQPDISGRYVGVIIAPTGASLGLGRVEHGIEQPSRRDGQAGGIAELPCNQEVRGSGAQARRFGKAGRQAVALQQALVAPDLTQRKAPLPTRRIKPGIAYPIGGTVPTFAAVGGIEP